MDPDTKKTDSSFPELWIFLKERVKAPGRHVSLYCYFIVAICGFGLYGAYVEFLLYLHEMSDLHNIALAIHSSFPAIAASAVYQLLNERAKHVRSFAFFYAFILIVIGSLRVIPSEIIVFCSAIIGFIFAGLIWLIANGTNPVYLDGQADDSIGGKTTDGLGGIGGFSVK